eukprot:TRINITY_DN7912_c0_g1_i1.p1 TRINITY_DN7912_c0_g1~~TRINITY_DN7912_c0_g1_i1.p1  ORF type:complete len:389 (-),score=79.45 TRINITY_DN7912_c0_g1_i1:11-1177(-)
MNNIFYAPLVLSLLALAMELHEVQAKETTRTPKELSKLPFQFRIPRTSFTCKSRAPGYYADVEASCEVYHMCTERGGKQSFLCPPRTRFNQKTLVCDFRRNVKCIDSSGFFHKNIVLKDEKRSKEPPQIKKGNNGKGHKAKGKNLNKRPRLSNQLAKLGLIEKKPQFIKAQGNGQMSFAPLFKEKSRHNLARILDISTLKDGKAHSSINEIHSNKKKALTNIKKDKKKLFNSPIIHISPSHQKAHSFHAEMGLRQDPERRPLNPFQIVGHVMSSKELTSFPDSPMVNISVQSDAHMGPAPQPNARAVKAEPGLVPGSEELGLPLQLKKVSDNRSPPLIWISPASLARSPMVSLRRLWDRSFPIRRTLTMSFPDLPNPHRRISHSSNHL